MFSRLSRPFSSLVAPVTRQQRLVGSTLFNKSLASTVAAPQLVRRFQNAAQKEGVNHLKDCSCPFCKPLSLADEDADTFYVPRALDASVFKGYERVLTPEQEKAMYEVSEEGPAPVDIDGREITTLSSIIRKYGTLPFIGLGSVALFAKEVIIYNEHLLLYINFLLFSFGAYVGLGDSIWKGVVESAKQEVKWWNDFNSLQVEGAFTQLRALETAIATPAVIRAAQTEFNESAEKLYRYLNLQQRHHARNDTVRKLEQIKKREEDASSSLTAQINAGVFDFVTSRVRAAPAAEKSALLEMAIKSLEGKEESVTVETHPVYKYVAEYYTTKPWEKELKNKKK